MAYSHAHYGISKLQFQLLHKLKIHTIKHLFKKKGKWVGLKVSTVKLFISS